MRRFFCLLAMGAFLGFSGLVHGATFNVSPGADSDCSDFVCDLQSALNVATANGEDDTLQLAAGTYDASGGTFTYPVAATENKTLTIIGAGKDQTFLDGGGSSQVMQISTLNATSDSLSDISISNLTVQNGFTNSSDGAGLLIQTENASVNIQGCNFLSNDNKNSSGQGGGLMVDINHSGKITLSGNRFDKNDADDSGAGAFLLSSVGGGITVVGNTFTKNIGAKDGGGLVAEAGFGDIALVGNNFTGNIGTFSSSGGQGGAAFVVTEIGNITVNRNLFSDNIGSMGGGLFSETEVGKILFTNNIFTGNQAINSSPGPDQGGGGAFLEVFGSNSAVVTNNTFVGNKTINGDGGGLAFSSDLDSNVLDLYNNIVFNNLATGSSCPDTCNDIFINDDKDGNKIGSPVNVFNNDYSDISFQCNSGSPCTETHQNVDATSNIIDKDPMFANAVGGDFSLLTGSPAIDAGTAAAPGLPTTDFAGKPRNQGSAPDMGALESTPPHVTPPPTPEDCSNNVDDDGDKLIDCNDPDCSGSPACAAPTPPGVENCTNGVDDDGDGNIDCNDPDCAGSAACQGTPSQPGSENCSNNVDDDGDGLIDCNDPDCSGAAACQNAGTPTTSVSAKGCAMATTGEGSPSSLFYLLVPLFVAAGRWMRKPQSSRGE